MVAAHISKVCSALFEPLVNLKEISENPSRYLFGFGFYAFTTLIDMKPPPGALLYIHSASELYNEEQVLSKERVVDNWLDKFGMERHQMHYSGHAKGKDLFEIVKTIDAISNSYTEHPEMYVGVITTRNMTVVHEGKTYLI